MAVTATAGAVSPEQATRNVEIVIEQLDPPRWPRIGAALPDYRPRVSAAHLHGADGLGGVEFRVAELHHRHPSDKVICDEVRAAPEEVTIVALGPLTNIAAALQRDPDLATLVGHLIIRGGAVAVSGDVTAAAEFNIYGNPIAAATVFRSPVTKTLIPLDVTSRIVLTFDFLDRLPGEWSETGSFFRKVLPSLFRAYRQEMGLEGIHAHDAVGMLAASRPDLFPTQPMTGDVETAGYLTMGSTVFDRRRLRKKRPNMEVAVSVDAAAVIETMIGRLTRASDGGRNGIRQTSGAAAVPREGGKSTQLDDGLGSGGLRAEAPPCFRAIRREP